MDITDIAFGPVIVNQTNCRKCLLYLSALKRLNHLERQVKGSQQLLLNTPTRFQVENMMLNIWLFPKSHRNDAHFIPIGFESSTLASNLLKIMPNAKAFHFGILSSTMHMAWVRATCGRLESRYRYSKDIVYNTFPGPLKQRTNKKQRLRKQQKEFWKLESSFLIPRLRIFTIRLRCRLRL